MKWLALAFYLGFFIEGALLLCVVHACMGAVK